MESVPKEDTNTYDEDSQTIKQAKQGMQRAVVNAVVDEIVMEIQESIPADLWEDVLQQLHLRIGNKSRNLND